jgi:hypothetical protein
MSVYKYPVKDGTGTPFININITHMFKLLIMPM